ncbi:hypothetical protein ES708_23932 [subsurface metagenome]
MRRFIFFSTNQALFNHFVTLTLSPLFNKLSESNCPPYYTKLNYGILLLPIKRSKETKLKLSKARKKYYENPKNREKNRKAQIEAQNRPEVKLKRKKWWDNLSIEKKIELSFKISKGVIKHDLENPEYRDNISKGQIKRFKNMTFEDREKFRIILIESFNRPEVKLKMSISAKKRAQDPEWRRKRSEGQKMWAQIPENMEQMSRISLEVQNRPEVKLKKSISRKKWWKNLSIEEKEKIREKQIKINNTPEHRLNSSIAQKRYWKNLLPEEKKIVIEKMLKANKCRPTNPEKVFDELTPDNVRYVGNGSWYRWTGKKHRNPDFKITGQNKVIEIFGTYWHRDENPKDIIQEYKGIGIECIVFWEHEIIKIREKVAPKPELERVLKETLEFIGDHSDEICSERKKDDLEEYIKAFPCSRPQKL